MDPRIHIVARKNGVGIDRDVDLIEAALRPLGTIDVRSQKSPERVAVQLREQLRTLIGPDRGSAAGGRNPALADPELFVCVERVPRVWGRLPGRVVLLPNQERFPRRHLSRLRHVDLVLCKTRHAETVFREHTDRVAWTGFTSTDRRLPGVMPDFDRCFHLAGRSTLKGTETLLEVWSRHPDWPELTVVQSPATAPPADRVPRNVRLLTGYLADADLRVLQNRHGIHLCPSRSEGWGHYIVEAMSCGAVVLTTDGPPMNELVGPDRGVLVPWQRSEPRHLGTNWYVDADALEAAIQRVLDLSVEAKSRLGTAARSWYESCDADFHRRLPALISGLLTDRNESEPGPLPTARAA